MLLLLLVLITQTARGAVFVTPQVYIVIDPDVAAPVHRAVGDLERDIERVLGQLPRVANSLTEVPDGISALVVVGPAWSQEEPTIAGDITGFEAHEHGIFEDWYKPLVDKEMNAHFRVRERRESISDLFN